MGVFKRQTSNNPRIDSTQIKINKNVIRGNPKYGKIKVLKPNLVNKNKKKIKSGKQASQSRAAI